MNMTVTDELCVVCGEVNRSYNHNKIDRKVQPFKLDSVMHESCELEPVALIALSHSDRC